jgi:hypothetical protein
MRNKTPILLVLFLISVGVSGATRSLVEKKKIAEKYLYTNKTRAEQSTLRMLVEKEQLSVLGNEQNGFVIINNNDQLPAVIGYSQAAFDTMPPALEWYLDAVEQSLQAINNKGAYYELIPPTSDVPSSVGSLVKTTWNQGNPYNKYCPSGNGGKASLYPTGCVATALAQIMNYHNYPQKGIGSHQYSFKPADGDGRIIEANFGETTYDWANMLNDYASVAYTDEQANAVATLMLHCGVAVDMMYTASGSGSYGQEACLGIKKYFGYNKNARLYMRDFYTAETWMQMVYTELSKNRPIYYAGVSQSSGGHAFVIDGYNQEGLVHVNWGWGGKSNGMFDIALLNPTGYQFSLSQDMIIGMCDSTVNIPYESQIAARDLSFNFYGSTTKRVTVSGKIYNAAVEKFNGKIACVLENNDTTIVLKSQDDFSLNPITGGQWSYTSLSIQSCNLSNVPDGTYRLFVGSRTNEDYKWQLVRQQEGAVYNYIIVKNGSDITWTEDYTDTWALSSSSTTTGISSVKTNNGTNATKSATIYTLDGRNMGTNPSALPKGIYIINGRKVIK